MIRYATRIALIALLACLVNPVPARAQAPWRQVYKDADVTVIFDTASLALQSPGTWTTGRRPIHKSSFTNTQRPR